MKIFIETIFLFISIKISNKIYIVFNYYLVGVELEEQIFI
jgi:hypothetical protein